MSLRNFANGFWILIPHSLTNASRPMRATGDWIRSPIRRFMIMQLANRSRYESFCKPPATKEARNLAARFAIVDYTCDDSDEIKPYDLSQDYFRFTFASDLQPTNNHCEQQIRHCVIDRKITQGTRSQAGSLDVVCLDICVTSTVFLQQKCKPRTRN